MIETRISTDLMVHEDAPDGWIGIYDEVEGQEVRMTISEGRAFRDHLDSFLDHADRDSAEPTEDRIS